MQASGKSKQKSILIYVYSIFMVDNIYARFREMFFTCWKFITIGLSFLQPKQGSRSPIKAELTHLQKI